MYLCRDVGVFLFGRRRVVMKFLMQKNVGVLQFFRVSFFRYSIPRLRERLCLLFFCIVLFCLFRFYVILVFLFFYESEGVDCVFRRPFVGLSRCKFLRCCTYVVVPVYPWRWGCV